MVKKPLIEARKDLKQRTKSPIPQTKQVKAEKKEISISLRDMNRSIEPIASKKAPKFDAHNKGTNFKKVKKPKEVTSAKVPVKQPDLRFSQRTVGIKGQIVNSSVNIRPSQKSFKPVLAQTTTAKPLPVKHVEKPNVTYMIEVDSNFGEINETTDKPSDRRNSVNVLRSKNPTKAKECKSPNGFSKTSKTPRSFGEQLQIESKIRSDENAQGSIRQFEIPMQPTEPNETSSELIRIINLNQEDLDSITKMEQQKMKKKPSSTRIQQHVRENKTQVEQIEPTSAQIPNYEEIRLKYKKSKVSGETREELVEGHEALHGFNNTDYNFSKARLNMPLADRTGISERVFAITKGYLSSNLISQRDCVESDKLITLPISIQALQAPPDQGFRARSRSRYRPGQLSNQSAVEMLDRPDLNSTLSKVRKSLDELTIENNEWRKTSREKRIARLAVCVDGQQHPLETFPTNPNTNNDTFNKHSNPNSDKHISPLSRVLVLNPKSGPELMYAHAKLSNQPVDSERQVRPHAENLSDIAQKTLTRIHRQ